MLTDLEACDLTIAKMKELLGKKIDNKPLTYKVDLKNKEVAKINHKVIEAVVKLGREIHKHGIDKKLTKDQILKIVEISKLTVEEERVIKQQRQIS
jgi:uncharacterized protein YicC (UPF0701 family)